jgi:ribose transport system substrate-binding protein
VHRGYLAKSAQGTYRHVAKPTKLCFGFGSQGEGIPFSNDVRMSLSDAAAKAGIDILVLDNHYDAVSAIQNAKTFVEKKVDVVVEFQVQQSAAAAIGDTIAAAKIPFIAVDIPHPNSIFFGVDNYRAGMAAGELLGQHAIKAWNGRVDGVLGLDLPSAGQLVQGRIAGAFAAIQDSLPNLPQAVYERIDSRGLRDYSEGAVRTFLEKNPESRRILIAAVNDSSALGAVDAAKALKRTRQVVIVGQDCIEEAMTEMRRPSSPLIGSVSHETAAYGPALIRLGLSLLRGEAVAPYNYVNHRVVTRNDLS